MSEEDLTNMGEDDFHGDEDLLTNNLVIIGGGTMGRGITIVAAKRDIEVLLIEKNEASLERSLGKIADSLDREISRWAMTESEKNAIFSRIKGVVEFSEITDQQLIIEALTEDFELKKSVFKELDKYCPDHSILITNTSTLSITELASETERPDRVIGMHFLRPVQKIKLIEIVKGLNTSTDTFRKAMALAKYLERTPIEVFETPGYVTTRVFIPLVNEAIQVLMEGVASAEDIDTAIRIGYEIPTGPLAMADEIGLDQVLKWMETLFHDLGDAKYRPCPLLKMLVRAGHLGIKTNQGFFKYDEEGSVIPGSGQKSSSVR